MLIDTVLIYHFIYPDPRVLRYSSKKEGQQKKGALILKQGIETPLHIFIEGCICTLLCC